MSSWEAGRRRTVFVDVDGTMIDHFGEVAPEVSAAIREARSRGHRFFVCTGRGAADVPESVTAVGFDGAITNGGAFARVGEDLVVEQLMGADLARRILDYLEGIDVGVLVQTDARTYGTPRAVDLSELHDREYRRRHPEVPGDSPSFADRVRGFGDVSDADLSKVVKIVFLSDRKVDLSEVQRSLGAKCQVIDGSLPLSEGTSAEICVAGVTKGYAIEQVAKHLGIPLSDTIGIGDSWNDLEMFQVVGDSVAMGNADPELKRHADMETSTVQEHGVVRALENLGLLGASGSRVSVD